MRLTFAIASREMDNGTVYWGVQVCTDGLLPFGLPCLERSYAEDKLAERKRLMERFGDEVEVLEYEINWPVNTKGVPIQRVPGQPEEGARDGER